jgi:peroxiredoxin
MPIRQRYRRDLAVIAAVGALALLLTTKGRHNSPAAPEASRGGTNPTGNLGAYAGYLAPDFKLMADDGQDIRLRDLRGRQVLLYFFCGCAACVHLARVLERLPREIGGLAVLGITTIGSRDRQRFRADSRSTFPILFDPNYVVATRYSSLDCPRSWLIDRNGIVSYVSKPYAEESLMVSELRKHLTRR